MSNKIIYRKLSQTESIRTSHSVGQKQVLLNSLETQTNITQVAYGVLEPGEIVAEHAHNDMEECFFFIEGKGAYKLDKVDHEVHNGTFIKIPINTLHELRVEGNEPLRFIYWGIAK